MPYATLAPMQLLRHRKRGTGMFQANQLIDGDITIRRLAADDAAALRRVAERDSSVAPEGSVYGAVAADGSILAAISLETRALVADPFVHSAHASALLRVWARELEGASRPTAVEIDVGDHLGERLRDVVEGVVVVVSDDHHPVAAQALAGSADAGPLESLRAHARGA
jgi:hypothetical protein